MPRLVSRRILQDNTNYLTYVINKFNNGYARIKIFQKYSGCYVLVGTQIVRC